MILLYGKDDGIRKTVCNMLHLLGAICIEGDDNQPLPVSPSLLHAQIILSPEYDIRQTIVKIRDRHPSAPLFTLLDKHPAAPSRALVDKAFSSEVSIPHALFGIIEDCRHLGRTPPCSYEALGIRAHINTDGVYYLGRKISFTKTEAMLLRALLIAHPKPLYASALLSVALSPSRELDVANVRTHVSVMNKKFLFHTGLRLIKANERGQYALCI